jgi:Alkylmercury lyase
MDAEDLRLAVYRAFAETGRAPEPDELATKLGTEAREVATGLAELARGRHLALGDQGQIVMAHPFSAVPLGFSVMGARTLWWGGCAWDSFALPHLLPSENEVLVATRCPACGRPHAWNVGRHRPPGGGQVAHFLVPAARMWDDVVHTCAHQRLFCSEDCVGAWLAATGSARGDVLDLGTLWRLAAHWYDGRLDRGYVRRDPSQSAAYLRGVGLAGPFWGL